MEGEVSEISGKFPKIWEKFPRNFRVISGKRTELTEIYWNYWNFEITENSVQLKFTEITEIFKSLLKLSPTTEITETEITNLGYEYYE